MQELLPFIIIIIQIIIPVSSGSSTRISSSGIVEGPVSYFLFNFPSGVTFTSLQAQLFPTIDHKGKILEAAVANSSGRRAMIYEPPRQDLKRPPCRHNLAFKLDPRRPPLTPQNHRSDAAAAACRQRVTACLASILPLCQISAHPRPTSVALPYLAYRHWVCARLSARERDRRQSR